MTKATVTKIFLGGVLAAIAGGIVVLVAGGIAYTNDVFVMNGQEVVGLRGGALTWTLLGVGLVGHRAVRPHRLQGQLGGGDDRLRPAQALHHISRVDGGGRGLPFQTFRNQHDRLKRVCELVDELPDRRIQGCHDFSPSAAFYLVWRKFLDWRGSQRSAVR